MLLRVLTNCIVLKVKHFGSNLTNIEKKNIKINLHANMHCFCLPNRQ